MCLLHLCGIQESKVVPKAFPTDSLHSTEIAMCPKTDSVSVFADICTGRCPQRITTRKDIPALQHYISNMRKLIKVGKR